MKPTTTSNWFSSVFFAFVVSTPIYILVELIKHGQQVGFNNYHFLGFFLLVLWFVVMPQLLLEGFMRLHIYTSYFMFEKPFQKWTWRRAKPNVLNLQSDAWDELVIYEGLRNQALLYFKHTSGSVAFVSTGSRSTFVQAIQAAFPNKIYTWESIENIPKKTINRFKKEFPERVMRG